MTDCEPAKNVSGDESGGNEAAFDPATAGTRVEAVRDRLGELYWIKTYGGRDAFERPVRTMHRRCPRVKR